MNRLEWILGIFLVVLLLVVLALAVMLWTQPSSPPAISDIDSSADRAALIAPTPVFEGETAKPAYELAQTRAQAWQSDVTLLSAEATWPQGTSVQDLLMGTSTWSFTFYSPGQRSVRQITVVEDQVSLLAERAYEPSQPLPSANTWQVDSDTAIQYFLVEGGHEFIREEEIATLIMSLRTDDPQGRLTWFISSFAAQTNHSLSMNIDAATGEIIDIDRIP